MANNIQINTSLFLNNDVTEEEWIWEIELDSKQNRIQIFINKDNINNKTNVEKIFSYISNQILLGNEIEILLPSGTLNKGVEKIVVETYIKNLNKEIKKKTLLYSKEIKKINEDLN